MTEHTKMHTECNIASQIAISPFKSPNGLRLEHYLLADLRGLEEAAPFRRTLEIGDAVDGAIVFGHGFVHQLDAEQQLLAVVDGVDSADKMENAPTPLIELDDVSNLQMEALQSPTLRLFQFRQIDLLVVHRLLCCHRPQRRLPKSYNSSHFPMDNKV